MISYFVMNNDILMPIKQAIHVLELYSIDKPFKYMSNNFKIKHKIRNKYLILMYKQRYSSFMYIFYILRQIFKCAYASQLKKNT